LNAHCSRGLVAAFAAFVVGAGLPAAAVDGAAATTAARDQREAPSIMQRTDQAYASRVLPFQPAAITRAPRAVAPDSTGSAPRAPRAQGAQGAGLNREVFGFAPYWALASSTTLASGELSDVEYDKLSTVAYFGLTLDSNGMFVNDAGLAGWGSAQMNDLVARAHSYGDRVVVTAKTFNDPDINSIVHNPSTGQQAINSVINAVQNRGLDGVNVDFEGSTSSAYPTLQQDFTSWIHSLSDQLHQRVPGSFLTVDTYSGSASWSGGFMRIDTLAPYVDAFFVMTYDMGLSNASAQGLPGTLPNAPLSGNYTYTDSTAVDQYLQKSGDPNKIILGVPYYGYKFSTNGTGFNASIDYNTTGCASACADPYSTILSEFACAPQLQLNWDSASVTPWASWWSPATGDPCGANHGTTRELYYDNAASIGGKYDLVIQRNIRGSGIWALGYDHGTTDLWNVIATKFESPCRTNLNGNTFTASHPSQQVAGTGVDCALWVHSSSAPGFSGLGGILLGAPAVVPSGPSSDPYYVVTGADRDLYIRSGAAGWQRLNTGGAVACLDNPAATVVANVLWVGCQGTDHALYAGHATLPGSGLPQIPYSSWQYLGGILVNGPGVVGMGGGATFFVVGGDHHIYWRTPSGPGFSYIGWLCNGHPAVAGYGVTSYFACQGADHALWYATNIGAGWSAAASLGGVVIDGPGVAAGPTGPTFFVEGQDTVVWERGIGAAWKSDGGLVQYGVGAAWIQ